MKEEKLYHRQDSRLDYQKNLSAKSVGCRYYIHLHDDESLLVSLKENERSFYVGNFGDEFIVTKENYLINVSANSIEALIKEVERGKSAVGYIGMVKRLWFTKGMEELVL